MTVVEYQGRTFDRVPRYDDASRNYPIRALIPTPTQPRSYTWACPVWLDQGYEGACVGYSIAHEIGARPKVHPVDTALAQGIYEDARRNDEWPGEDYDGTSVLAGVKEAKRRGYYSEYRWAFGLTDALLAVSRKGPGIMGCWWHDGMFEPDDHGFLHPTGGRIGGHAVLVNGVSITKRIVRIHNSWGLSWGRNGEAFLTWEDFESLLLDEGELCIPVRL